MTPLKVRTSLRRVPTFVPLLFFALIANTARAVDIIQGDCTPAELRVLKNKDSVEQIVPEGKIKALDCAVLHDKVSAKLLLTYIVESPEISTRLVIFTRAGLSSKAKPWFVSESLGYESLPILAKGKKRLLFVLPGKNNGVIEFYTSTQTVENGLFFAKHSLNLQEKSLADVPDHKWKIDINYTVKIFLENGQWKAILKGKIVDL